jgi:hypothetical protein
VQKNYRIDKLKFPDSKKPLFAAVFYWPSEFLQLSATRILLNLLCHTYDTASVKISNYTGKKMEWRGIIRNDTVAIWLSKLNE